MEQKRGRYEERETREDRHRDYDDRDRDRDRREYRDRDEYSRDRRDSERGEPRDTRERDREHRDRDRDRGREHRDRDRDRDRREPRDRERGADHPRESRPDREGQESRPARSGRAEHAEKAQQAEEAAAEKAAQLELEKQAEEQQYKQRVEEQVMALEMEDDEEREQRLIEERRRRRAEIAAKFKQQQEEQQRAADESPAPAGGQEGCGTITQHKVEKTAVSVGPRGSAASAALNGSAAEPRAAPSAAALPAGETTTAMETGEEAPPAGDSESDDESAPVIRKEVSTEARAKESELRAYLLDHRRRMEGGAPQTPKPSESTPNPDPEHALKDEAAPDAAETTEEAAPAAAGDGFDMFNDDVEEAEVAEDALEDAAAMDRGDNYDDKEGYYAHRIGDLLNDRYKVLGTYGKGVFSTVVRCQDVRAPPGHFVEVAVKVQRNNEMMRRAGEKEILFLQQLVENDPDNRRHCIHMFDRFDHEDHLCMVFEAMHQNLRQALRQHGHKRGIQIDAVRTYARQLFTALRFMERLNIVHADLKPDNIVVNDKYNLLKVCDFGSACNAEDCEITPYLVSRFYRAPEIMMGLQYACPIDYWAAGATLFELSTGKIAFMGQSNNMMIKLIQEVKGKMPHKLIRKGMFSELHFDPDYDFLYKERDKVTNREVLRLIKYEQRALPGKDLKSLVMPNKLTEAEARKMLMLADLLEKTLMIDPSKRLTPSQALKHPFCDVTRK